MSSGLSPVKIMCSFPSAKTETKSRSTKKPNGSKGARTRKGKKELVTLDAEDGADEDSGIEDLDDEDIGEQGMGGYDERLGDDDESDEDEDEVAALYDD